MKKEKQDTLKYAILATDIVIFAIKDGGLNVLLVKVKKDYFKGLWAVPGGLVPPYETLDTAAKRKFYEITRTKAAYLEQLYTFGKVERDPQGRIVSVTYFALIRETDIQLAISEEFSAVEWYPVSRLPNLAYDHDEVIEFAIDRLQSKVTYSNIIYGLLPEEFTLRELQDAYEIVLSRKLDKRNFRKKIMSLKLVVQTDKKTTGKAHRPANLYRFRQKQPVIIKIL